MMDKKLLKKLSLLLFAAATALTAKEIPADLQVIEAESFDNSQAPQWRVKAHFRGWYGGIPSNGHFLAGNGRKQGQKAFKSVSIPKAGKYFLHLRYIDVLNHRGDFTVTITQNGKTLASKTFDAVSLRATPEGKKKYGKNFAKFVWQDLDFTAAAGKVTIV